MLAWEELYKRAVAVQRARRISPFIEAGAVAAALLTAQGHVYVGVCIDTACSLGMCAERNAVASMITGGESEIVRLVCVMGDGRVGPPCGACREYLMQLHENSPRMEVLLSLQPEKSVRLEELIPEWWGAGAFENDGQKT